MSLSKEHVDEVENLLELCGDELYNLVGAEPRTGHSRIRVERTIQAPSGDIKVTVSEGPHEQSRTVEAVVFAPEEVWGRKADMPPQEWSPGLLRELRHVLVNELQGEGEGW